MTLPDIVCRPIGLVHIRFTEASGMPIQAAGAPEETGRVEVFPAYAAGLKDIEGFDYLILLTHLPMCHVLTCATPTALAGSPTALTRCPPCAPTTGWVDGRAQPPGLRAGGHAQWMA